MIDIHYWPTPNGKKVTILLEELGVPYNVVPVQISRGDQFTDGFLRISPNNRMPAIVDQAPTGGGAAISVFESGAIMMYLAEKEGRFWPQDDVRAKSAAPAAVISQPSRLRSARPSSVSARASPIFTNGTSSPVFSRKARTSPLASVLTRP